MRVMVMFDLPVITPADRKEYTRFRKHLLKNGFLMMQESIYCKLVPNVTSAEWVINSLRAAKPEKGLVQVLKLTEKQYSKIEYIVGKNTSDVLESDQRLVFI